jgi:V/A-type H+/Na+-transporting ATPase subunit C
LAGAVQKYAFINAKLRARISKILPEEVSSEMSRAKSLSEAMEHLRNTDFALVENVFGKTGDLKMAELELARKEVKLYLELEALTKDEVRAIVYALAERFEVENLKHALRLWFDNRVRGRRIDAAVGYLLRDRVHRDLPLDRIVNSGSLEEAAEALAGTPYGELVGRQAEEVARVQSLFPVEIALDHYFYRQLLAAVDGLGPRDREIARRMIGAEIDLANINWLIRFKGFYKLPPERALACAIPEGIHFSLQDVAKAYAMDNPSTVLTELVRHRYPGLGGLLTPKEATESYARLVLIERILAEILMLEVRHLLVGYPFTIGILLAYFVLKSAEIRRIRTVLNAKFYDWPEERIMAAL